MSKYGMTRVTYVGDKTIIVAGAVPEDLLVGAVKVEAVPSPGTPVRPLRKPGTLVPLNVPNPVKEDK